MTDDRAIRALEDVVAIEHMAPGMVRVCTWSDEYVVDARDGGCTCPDQEYNLQGDGRCKHEWAAVLATTELPSPTEPVDSLTADGPTPILADGGERPDDCTCDEDDLEFPCFACYRDGFEEAAPDAADSSRERPTRSEPADFGGGESTGVQEL